MSQDTTLTHSDTQCCETQNLSQESRQEQQVRTYRPHVDVVETEDAFLLWADLPGVDEQSTEISIEKNVLTIVGNPVADDNSRFARRYERSFRLSDEIDREKIDAVVNNGVLKLHLPKAQHAMAKKITVRAG